jgi:AAA+ superfamily predicted ATPase
MRAIGNDVGEIRRILNSFLQFIDHDCSNSIIIAATNHPQMLDYALFRRFDDVIEYLLPDKKQIQLLIKNRVDGFVEKEINYEDLSKHAEGLSYAEITRACEDAIKEKIILQKDTVSGSAVMEMLNERKKYHSRMTSTYANGQF